MTARPLAPALRLLLASNGVLLARRRNDGDRDRVAAALDALAADPIEPHAAVKRLALAARSYLDQGAVADLRGAVAGMIDHHAWRRVLPDGCQGTFAAHAARWKED